MTEVNPRPIQRSLSAAEFRGLAEVLPAAKRFAVKRLRTLTTVGAIFVGLVACGSETNVTELTRVRSPDGEFEAVLTKIQAGGAPGTASLAVFLGSANQPVDRRHPPVFEAVGCATVPMEWTNSKSLTVSYESPCEVVGFRSRWYRPNPPARDAFVDVVVKKFERT